MGEKTEELIKKAKHSISVLEGHIRDLPNSKTSPIKTLKRVKEANHQAWHKDHETLLTEKMYYNNAWTTAELHVKQAKVNLTALTKQIKVKNVLDIFKTQKSLGEAKEVAKSLEEKIKKAEVAAKEVKKSAASFAEAVKEVIDAVPAR